MELTEKQMDTIADAFVILAAMFRERHFTAPVNVDEKQEEMDFDEPYDKETSEEDEKIYTKKDVREALGVVLQEHGAGALEKILNKYNAKILSDVPAESYEAVIEDCRNAG